MSEIMTYVPSRLTSAKPDKVLAGANEILDDNIHLKQNVINVLTAKIVTLSSAPTSETLTYDVDGVTCNFNIGDFVRVLDAEKGDADTNNYIYYNLFDIDNGVAYWSQFKGAPGPQGPAGEQGPKGDDGVTPTINAAAGSNIGSVGTPSVTATTSGNTTTFTFNYLKGASGANGTNGTTPTIKAAAGSAIGSVGTPSVTASTSGTTTTFTFNYLKGATGAQGPQGPKGNTGATGPQGPKGATGPQGPAGVTGLSFASGNCTVVAANSPYYLAYIPYTLANAKKAYCISINFTNSVNNTLIGFSVPYTTSYTFAGKTMTNCFYIIVNGNPGTTTYKIIAKS